MNLPYFLICRLILLKYDSIESISWGVKSRMKNSRDFYDCVNLIDDRRLSELINLVASNVPQKIDALISDYEKRISEARAKGINPNENDLISLRQMKRAKKNISRR